MYTSSVLISFLVTTSILQGGIANAADFSFGCDLKLAAPSPEWSHPLIQTNFIGGRIATFESGTFDPNEEVALKKARADIIFVDNPTENEIEMGRDNGYYLAPVNVLWTRPIVSFENFLELKKSDERSRFKSKLKRSENVRTEIGPITLEDFNHWYSVYEEEVVARERGRRVIEPTWAAEKGTKLKRYRKMFFYDKDSGEFLGGMILRKQDKTKTLQAPYAAYKSRARDLNLGVRAFAEAMNYGAKRGYSVLSYGSDTNLYGHHLPISLMEYKSSLGLAPTTASSKERLVKVLNPDFLNRDYFLFVFEERRMAGHHFRTARAS